jgi:hypothetical protein
MSRILLAEEMIVVHRDVEVRGCPYSADKFIVSDTDAEVDLLECAHVFGCFG